MIWNDGRFFEGINLIAKGKKSLTVFNDARIWNMRILSRKIQLMQVSIIDQSWMNSYSLT